MSSNCFGKMYCFCKGSLEVVPHVYDNGQKYGSRYGLNRVWELYKGGYSPRFSSARISNYMRSETLKVDGMKEEQRVERVNESVEQIDAREEIESGKKIGEEIENRRGNERDERLEIAGDIELDRREILRLMIENARERQMNMQH